MGQAKVSKEIKDKAEDMKVDDEKEVSNEESINHIKNGEDEDEKDCMGTNETGNQQVEDDLPENEEQTKSP